MAPFHNRALAIAFLLLLALTFPLETNAQLTRGAIFGTVRDEAGAAIPGATVKVIAIGTNVTRDAVTDENGYYRIGAVEPGKYTVRVEKTGFSTVENQELVLNSAAEAAFDVNLKVGNVTETVDVTADVEAISLNKTNGTIGTVIETRRAQELPLGAARNINNLALLSPNVFTAPGSTGISANGQRARNNNFTIDGSDNNDITVTISTVTVIPEAVGEFQIQTNPYNAENGRNTGAAINVITQSGKNKFHGAVWEYYRGSDLNALTNVQKASGLTSPPQFNRNQFGFAIGGPVYFLNFGEGVPAIYDGHDRTFFFYSLQGDKQTTGTLTGGTIRIPTPAGFAALGGVPLRTTPSAQSPASRAAVMGQLQFLNDIYAQNPTFRNFTNLTVNGVSIQTGQTNIGISQPATEWNHTFRFDHQISENDNLTARLIYVKSDSTNVISNLNFGSLFSGDQLLKDWNFAVSESHVFSPSVINEFRFSYIKRNLDFPENDPVTPTTTITGLVAFGGANNFPQSRVSDFWQYADTVTWIKDQHNFKFGGDIRRNLLDNFSGFDFKGTFAFNSLQDYMNNVANTFTQAFSAQDYSAPQWQMGFFAQDDWRITNSLTLNLGIRYENSTVPFGFFGTTDPAQRAALVPGPVERDNDNWAPVFGFAYSPSFEGGFMGRLFGDRLTSVRGGFRKAYDVLFYNILVVNGGNFPITTSIQQNSVLDVFPTLAPPTTFPTFNPLATFVNSPSDVENPESYLYSLSVQREIARRYILEVGYTGSRSLRQINQLQNNPAILTPAQIATVLSTRNSNSIPSVQARRIFPQFGSRVIIGGDAQATYNAGFLSLKRRFANGLTFDIAYTFSKLMSNNDESLGVGAITGGSPQIPQDFGNYAAEKSVSVFDRTHRFVTNFLYEIPMPRFVESNAWSKALLGGFQISGIVSYQSGQPFTILTGIDSNGNGSAGDRPNFDPNGTLTLDPVTGNWRTFRSPLVGGAFFVPLNGPGGLSGVPLANSLGNGNLGKNTFRAPGFWNADLSVAKRFVFPWGGEQKHDFLIRADFLNAFNWDNYGIPVNNMSSADFGRNLNNWGNRSITLSGKYTF